ncbi:MAG TPA: (deoxy)nucleoside triphosphate pyrophosphohydrolase [Polyangia bacterium]|nr:(deoxy)nucleoside triphosphate pyrophosphohydrolase [Polyangia bacterium]
MAGEARARKLVVAALIRDGDGRVLLSRRRADQAMPLLWEFPGGKIEPGESPEAALGREVREELGCAVRVERIFDVVFHAYADFDLLMLVYACAITDGQPAPIEVAEIAWVAPARLPAMDLLPADFPLARALAAADPARRL